MYKRQADVKKWLDLEMKAVDISMSKGKHYPTSLCDQFVGWKEARIVPGNGQPSSFPTVFLNDVHDVLSILELEFSPLLRLCQ